jgi:hypothetical protein
MCSDDFGVDSKSGSCVKGISNCLINTSCLLNEQG